MANFSHIGKYLPKYNDVLSSTNAKECVDKLRKEKGNKGLVKFFEKAVSFKELKNDAALGKLFDRAIKKSDKLSESEKKKLNKAKSVFSEKVKSKNSSKNVNPEALFKQIEGDIKKLKKRAAFNHGVNNYQGFVRLKSGLKDCKKGIQTIDKIVDDKNNAEKAFNDAQAELKQADDPAAKEAAEKIFQLVMDNLKKQYNTIITNLKDQIQEGKKQLKDARIEISTIGDKKAKTLLKNILDNFMKVFDIAKSRLVKF